MRKSTVSALLAALTLGAALTATPAMASTASPADRGNAKTTDAQRFTYRPVAGRTAASTPSHMAASTAASLAGAPAAAGTGFCSNTTKKGPKYHAAGFACFYGNASPEYILVSDMAPDGHGAWARLWVWKGGDWVKRRTMRADGAYSQERRAINVVEGRAVLLKVCLIKNGNKKACESKKGYG